jgi:hypothetical protein
LSGGSGNQAWYWTPDGDSTIYEVNAATHRQLAYHLGTSCSVSCARAYPGLAVAPDGIVWGAVNHTLVRLDPATGRFTTIALVPPPPSVGEDNTDISNTAQSATAVAVGGRRQEVVIGFEFGSQIEVYSPGNPDRPPRIIALPSGFITNDVAILPDDTIGVVMQRFGAQPDPEIDIIASDGSSRHLRVPDCWGIEADGTAGFLAGEFSGPVLVTESGKLEPVPVRFRLPKDGEWGANGGDGPPTRLIVLPDRRVARPVENGFVAVASARGTVLFPMPWERYLWMPMSCLGCGPIPGRSTTTTRPHSKWVVRRALVVQVVSDDMGDLWILTSTPQSNAAFAELTAAQLRSAPASG